MGFFDRFKKKEENEIDPLHELDLPNLKVGFMVDYDMKTYQVTGYNAYDFGDGYTAEEWELTSGRDKLYLEMVEDDEVEWSLCKKISVSDIDGEIKKHIMEHDDPPNEIVYQEKTYLLDESVGGYMIENGAGPRHELIAWTFVDKEEKTFVTIEQWGETEFEAAAGWYAEEYQFENILPMQQK